MTIKSARIYYHPRRKLLERYLTSTHWAFADWFKRRLKPIRDQLGGPEAKGVDMVNFMLHENPRHAWRPSEWNKRGNTFNFDFVCDLSPLRNHPPIENIEKLMRWTSEVALQAPWPQVQAVGTALSVPLSNEERVSLAPYLTWPREFLYRGLGYDGEQLDAIMENGRREARVLSREAFYLQHAAGPRSTVIKFG